MTIKPNDIVDLYLTPVALHLNARLEYLSGKSSRELVLEVALATNREPEVAAERQQAMLETVTHLIDLHGWVPSWHERGLHLAHDEHSLVLGVPANMRSYLQP